MIWWWWCRLSNSDESIRQPGLRFTTEELLSAGICVSLFRLHICRCSYCLVSAKLDPNAFCRRKHNNTRSWNLCALESLRHLDVISTTLFVSGSFHSCHTWTRSVCTCLFWIRRKRADIRHKIGIISRHDFCTENFEILSWNAAGCGVVWAKWFVLYSNIR